MDLFERLQDFAQRAAHNYKYTQGAASALMVAVKLFTSVMTTEELAASHFPLDKLDELADRIFIKHGNKYSLDSLRVYKSRVNRIANDYKNYGADAKSMSSWNPSVKPRRDAGKAKSVAKSTLSQNPPQKRVGPNEDTKKPADDGGAPTVKVADVNLPLTGNRTVVVYYPTDLSEDEASKIGTVLKSIAALNN